MISPVPDIIYVDDDDPDGFLSLCEGNERDRFTPFQVEDGEPPSAALECAADANAWVFDFFLAEPQENEDNGLSLFSKWRQKIPYYPPIVLVSSDLRAALGEDLAPSPLRHHVLANRFGVEWVGDKNNRETMRRTLKIGSACEDLQRTLSAPAEEGKEQRLLKTLRTEMIVGDLLKVSEDVQWRETALRQVDAARPPRLSRSSSPRAVARSLIRWLIGHVLPYQSFLLDDAQAGLRLGVTPESFASIAATDRDKLGAALYRGPLQDFHGRRWWRAGLDHLAFDLDDQEGGFRTAFERSFGNKVDWLKESVPVLVSDADLVQTGEIMEAAECVRAVDEDFPSNVEPAWVPVALATDDRNLAAKVLSEDQYLVDPDE